MKPTGNGSASAGATAAARGIGHRQAVPARATQPAVPPRDDGDPPAAYPRPAPASAKATAW
jgi:hypothetical protein